MYSKGEEHVLSLVGPEGLSSQTMRRIELQGDDASLFDHDIDPDSDLEYLHSHKETFKQMWQDQGKKFWIRFLISFRWYTTNHGVLAEFPGEKAIFDAIIDRAFIYIHEVFIEGKETQAHNLLYDVYMLACCKGAIKHLEAKTISKDPFYAKDTRTVFRRLFGDPSNRKSYINVYFTMPLYVKFGGAVIECVKRWVDAPVTSAEDDTYWNPPQNNSKPSPSPQVSEQKKSERKKKKMDGDTGQSMTGKGGSQHESRSPAGVDEDYELYLEEKIRGGPYGPTLMTGWVFGDPRFVDPENPLYDTQADRRSDWRENLTFHMYRKFYKYVAVRYLMEDKSIPFEFPLYHPDIMTYPPPVHKRVYDEIERSFLDRCDKHYSMGVSVPTEKLSVEDLQAKDSFEIGKLNADNTFTYLETKKLPNPFPNVFPSLESNSRLMVVRRHIDQSGPFCDLASEDILLPERERDANSDETPGSQPASQEEEKGAVADDESQETQVKDASSLPERPHKPHKKKSKKSGRKPKETASDCTQRPDKSAAIVAAAAATGASKKTSTTESEGRPQTSQEAKASASASAAAAQESSEDSVLTDTSEDEAYWRRPLKGKGPNYPTCMEEMQIVPMSDIDPTVSGLFQLMALQLGDLDIFHFARRKATLPQPDCRDEFTYGHITGYTEKQTVDTMAVTIQKEWRNARRKRKREKRARNEKKRLIREEVERRRAERRTERAEKAAAAVEKGECKKAELMKQKSTKAEGNGSSLRWCTTCADVEPEPHTYKKCQRCQEEKVSQPRYYCSRDCQILDWKHRHRKEHNDNLL